MNDFDLDDLPFSPIDIDEENKEEKKEVKTISPESEKPTASVSEIASSFDSTPIINEEQKDIVVNNDDTKLDNIESQSNEIITQDILLNDTNTDTTDNINIFSNETDEVKSYIPEELKTDIPKDDKLVIKQNSKPNINTEKIKKMILFKGSRVIPVIAFVFVSILGVYIYLNNVNADIVNLIKIEENAKVGYIDSSGEVIVKAKYLYGTDYYKGYAVVKNYNSLYGVIDSKGNNKISFGNIFSATLYDNRYITSKFTSDGLKMGLLDENLDEVTRFKYDSLIYSKAGLFIFIRDETMGIMNNNGEEIYTYTVDEVDDRNISIEVSNITDDSDSDIYAKIKINSSYTIINTSTGKEVYRYTLKDINVLDNNVFYIKSDSENNKYFVIKDDEIVYETTEYKRVRIDSLDSNIALGIKENASIDYINLLTKEVINSNESTSYTYSDGVVLEGQYDFNSSKYTYTIYTPEKELGTFTDLTPDNNKYSNGYLKIKTTNDKYEFINKKGKAITNKEYETATDFNEFGYAIVSNDNSYGVIDGKGKEVVSLKYDEVIFLNDTLFKNIKKNTKKELFIYKDNSKYGIIDSDGNIVIKAIYNDFDIITTKYPIIKAVYGSDKALINLESFNVLDIELKDNIEIYDNYIICDDKYYNYNGELIYEIGG